MIRSFAALVSLAATGFGITHTSAASYGSGALNVDIPDAVSTGWVGTIQVPDAAPWTHLSVELALSVPVGESGWTGDIYAYLQHDSTIAILLNRPGKTLLQPAGYDDDQPISITFSDAASAGDIHAYRTSLFGDEQTALTSGLTGTWAPDGRAVDPDSVLDTSPRTALLAAFDGQTSAGDWNLFVADLSSGGTYRVDQWSLTFSGAAAIPESSDYGLVTGALLVTGILVARRRRRGLSHA